MNVVDVTCSGKGRAGSVIVIVDGIIVEYGFDKRCSRRTRRIPRGDVRGRKSDVIGWNKLGYRAAAHRRI
jgi:hypothetical protein